MIDPPIYGVCPVRQRRAVLVSGKCQYCGAHDHKLWTGTVFDLPGWNDDQYATKKRRRP